MSVVGCELAPPGGVEDGGSILAQPAALSEQVSEAKQAIEQDRCFLESADDSACDWASYVYSPGDFAMTRDTGEAILVIDQFPYLHTGLLRYRNRLKGFFRARPGGHIEPASHTWRVPRVLGEVLTRFASPDFIPAASLGELVTPILTTYRGHVDMFGHGLTVFAALVDRVPHHAIVLLDVDSLFLSTLAPESFCAPGTDPGAQQRLEAVARTTADGLRGVMHEKGVRYINASFGFSMKVIREEWQRVCRSPLPGDDVLRAKLLAYAPIMDALFNTEGVFAVHASDQVQAPEDSPFDLASSAYPNRLRIGVFGALESGVDTRGRGATRLPDFAFPKPGDADLYINHGCDLYSNCNATPLRVAGLSGVGSGTLLYLSTSWAAPVALARFISLRQETSCSAPLSNPLIQQLAQELTPSECPALPEGKCIFQDPLKHKQFEVYRLGYTN
ncbi:globin family protein [Archangium lipolyticum]|uniref:hypothetical protein n=1 Tax=Archangium lipolyticum TaxID=2970465 RepID=UPI00214A36E3|nr:hypothetical protein [Archangium lipolyticum]